MAIMNYQIQYLLVPAQQLCMKLGEQPFEFVPTFDGTGTQMMRWEILAIKMHEQILLQQTLKEFNLI